ncbi:AAA family ATPase [Nakamurella sp. YIM 132087]|uniref:RecBCD enzyme subunit RecB n=1 Tax=Nakamurella alba TaxID=2665158 RepID=A0A7K1FGQ3_9ACTN|nr:AAA family ATPase [Nakamurella alba]
MPAAAFDVTGALPSGTTVLEASAGTGKTWTVAALVTRYIAEGVAAPADLLVITFGRAASQELRERVRARLVEVERALGDPAGARASDDPLLRHLADDTEPEVARRRDRLTAAVADFDAATIATTHQFCQQVLTGLGVAGDSDAGTELVEDLDGLVVEVVDDIFLRAFGGTGSATPRFDRATALKLGRRAVEDPQADIEPQEHEPGSDGQWRVRFAGAVRAEVDRRKRRRRQLGYDDLLSRLADALAPEDSPARDRMRDRWKIVLVDEFQDTDHVQWEVLRRAFHGFATLVLIGDPKQAVYAFRGGDVVTYLTAVGSASGSATLAQNWRSDAALAHSLEVLLGGTALGDESIRVVPVEPRHTGRRLLGGPSDAPFRLRVARRDQFSSAKKFPPVNDVRAHIAEDLAADVAALLASGASWQGRPLAAGDIAVLVGTHAQGDLVQDALRRAGIPRVVSGAENVYASDAGESWLILLRALDQPQRAPLVRAAALTPFLGLDPVALGTGGEELTDRLSGMLRDWAAITARGGIAGLLETVSQRTGLWRRVLGAEGGERLLTDLRQVGEGLQKAATDGSLGIPGLLEWLTERRFEGTPSSDERARRLDSDASAVQIVTLHASKGLEYPVVYLPFVADRWVPNNPEMALLHDETGRRIIDLGGPRMPGASDRSRRALAEEAGETLRLLYVALTRAQSRLIAWWAPTRNAEHSALHRMLFGRRDDGRIPDRVSVPSDEVAWERLLQWERDGAFTVELATPAAAVPVPLPLSVDDFAVAPFDREVDLRWRRTSYSALTATDHYVPGFVADLVDPGTSEPEEPGKDDENDLTSTALGLGAGSSVDPGWEVPSPMADLPTGAAFGTVVHAVLEDLDPDAADPTVPLREACGLQLARAPMPVLPDDLAAALLPSLRTPLGPLADGRTLLDFPVRDRLSELVFELPLAGGDTPAPAEPRVGDLAGVLARHLPAGDPLAAYPDRLRDPQLAGRPLRGYLTGSIDAVLRTPGQRYLVADYKTNWLGDGLDPTDRRLTAWHYRPEAMAAEMMHSHYPLQALLYQVALHRFLRWRQPGYDPDRHLGGVLYLFLRGMCGPDGPEADGVPAGVFSWRPPVQLVTELSAVLDGGVG